MYVLNMPLLYMDIDCSSCVCLQETPGPLYSALRGPKDYINIRTLLPGSEAQDKGVVSGHRGL